MSTHRVIAKPAGPSLTRVVVVDHDGNEMYAVPARHSADDPSTIDPAVEAAWPKAEAWARRLDLTPVGVAEIAEMLGVSRQTADNWRQRPGAHLPTPVWTVGGRPAWPKGTIVRWAKRTGRL